MIRQEGVETALANDLVRLAAAPITTAVLLAGGEQQATAVWTARGLGVSVVLLVPAGCGVLVADALRAATTHVIGLHPEVFEALFHVHASRHQRRWRSIRGAR